MKIPDARTHPEKIRNLILFFLGISVGVLLMLLYSGGELNRLYIEIKKLRYENNDLVEKNRRIQEELTRWNQGEKVHDVLIHFVENKANEGVKAEIERRILQENRYLIGKDRDSLEETYQLLFHAYAPKIYVIGGKTYKVTLKTLIIAKKVHLFVEVTGGE